MRLGTITRVWKRVDSIEGMKQYKGYEVSNLGEIRSLYFKGYIGSKILKPRINIKYGYLIVGLWNGNKSKDFYVHRLVGLAFLPNPNNLMDVDHINSDKTNNNINNLQWLTHEDNVRKSRSKKILCIENGKVYNSITEASNELGIHHSDISRNVNKRRKQAGGKHFVFYCD